MPNAIDTLLTVYGAMAIGARAVVINARYRAVELRHAVIRSKVKFLLVGDAGPAQPDFRTMLCDALPELRDWNGAGAPAPTDAPFLATIASLDDQREKAWPGVATLSGAGKGVPIEAVEQRRAKVREDDIALMVFSSGTTSLPKLCMITNEGLVHSAASFARHFALNESDRMWNPLPFYHLSTLVPLAACRGVGATFIAEERFSGAVALRRVAEEQATFIYTAFPTLMADMFAQPDFDPMLLRTVRCSLNLGPPGLLYGFEAAVPSMRQVSCYGLSEASGLTSIAPWAADQRQRIDTIGLACAPYKMRIADPETGAEAKIGTVGEIQVGGPCVFKGYFDEPDKTEEVLTSDGWLRTGDLGTQDADGYFRFEGRLKDMIKVGGENVSAIEVESVLLSHPAVKVAQVIGVPDAELIETVAAYLELKPNRSLSVEEIVGFCAPRIASFKIPRFIRFVSAWPTGATKIQKFRLKEGFMAHDRIDVRKLLNSTRQSHSGDIQLAGL